MTNAPGEAKGAAEVVHKDALLAPIPDLTAAREAKTGYRDYPIDRNGELFDEELVNIADYGLAGQAYYSRPNAATGEAVPEVPKALQLRKSLAEKLADINKRLADPAITKFFGRPVELYIEDGLRAYNLQKQLYDQVFPHLIWQQNPGISDEQLDAKLRNLIAKPSDDEARPSPHATGGAADVTLRYKRATLGYVRGDEVPLGHVDGDTSDRVLPDYFEQLASVSEAFDLAQRNRRAFYAIMTGKVFGIDTGLQVNPTEFWHWSYGDQMWAKLRGEPAALYGLAGGST